MDAESFQKGRQDGILLREAKNLIKRKAKH